MKYELIGALATFISAISLLPAIFNTTIKKTTHSINFLYLLFGFIGQIFWLIYGIANKSYSIISLAIYLSIVYTIMAFSKWYYEKYNKDVYSQLEKKCIKDN